MFLFKYVLDNFHPNGEILPYLVILIGDQIGRLSNVNFGQCFENNKRSSKLWATFFPGKESCQFRNKLVGLLWGNFFTNSSGHPDCQGRRCATKCVT
jgi:hypothetical protein